MTALPRPVPAVLAALLAACSLGPDYQRPDAPVPDAFRATAATGAPAWPAADWWRGFGSPVLDGLIARAQAQNFDIQAAAARIRQADAALVVAGAPLLPAVTATAQDQWSRTSFAQRSSVNAAANHGISAGTYFETRLYSLTPSVSYELDFWGKLRAGRDAALGNALFSRFDRQTVALTALTGVATTWFQALATEDRLVVAQRNLTDAEQILAAIQARLEAGTASQSTSRSRRRWWPGCARKSRRCAARLAQQINGLGILTGQLPEAIDIPPGTLTTLTLPEVAPGLPSVLLARRPDVAAAEAQLQAAHANIRVARASFFPQIALTGSAGWQAYTLGTLFGPGSLALQAALGATQTIFDNGQLQGQAGAGEGPLRRAGGRLSQRRGAGFHRCRERAGRLPLRHRAGGAAARRGGHRPARRRYRPRAAAGRHQRHRAGPAGADHAVHRPRPAGAGAAGPLHRAGQPLQGAGRRLDARGYRPTSTATAAGRAMIPMSRFAHRYPRAGLVGRPRAKQRLIPARLPSSTSQSKGAPV